jgi:hypothetical protein
MSLLPYVFMPLKPEIHLNDSYKFSSYPTVCGQNAEFSDVNAGSMYSNNCALKA